jgi:hypothetical protein
MKSTSIFVFALAVVVYCSPALAQHGHAGGMGGNMGGGMGHGAADHNANTGSMSASHGQTMDQILTRNTTLAGKIQTLTGMSAQQACTGFKNLGQCVAAAHVSKNLSISFACLQADMTGSVPANSTSCPAGTGTKSMTLGKSIQALSPTADSKAAAKKATKQADQDINESSS